MANVLFPANPAPGQRYYHIDYATEFIYGVYGNAWWAEQDFVVSLPRYAFLPGGAVSGVTCSGTLPFPSSWNPTTIALRKWTSAFYQNSTPGAIKVAFSLQMSDGLSNSVIDSGFDSSTHTGFRWNRVVRNLATFPSATIGDAVNSQFFVSATVTGAISAYYDMQTLTYNLGTTS